MSVTRAELIEGLNENEPADAACRPALSAGAGFDVGDRETELEALTRIYARRVRHLGSRRIATIGADRLLDRLAGVTTERVRLGLVHSKDFNFQLFLEVDRPVVLATLGVAASAANPNYDWNNLIHR